MRARPRFSSRLCVALVTGACALAGCGASEHDQVQMKVKQFLNATAAKDYRTLCGQVLAPTLLERLAASGLTCERAMRIALGAVRSPTLSIGRINVNGSSASAITLTSAQGQPGSLDAIGLVKTGNGWRVASLGSPIVPAGKAK